MTDRIRHEDFATTEVIRPAAVLMEEATRLILAGLTEDDVHSGGNWWTTTGVWRRYDRPWPEGSDEPGPAVHLGTISCVYDSPQRYSVTIFRASITSDGVTANWTVDALCDDALRFANLTLASCPRALMTPVPQPFRQRGEVSTPVSPTGRG